jgi:hypothetical protein
VANIPANYGHWPEEQPPKRGDVCPGDNHPEYHHPEPAEVGLDELLTTGTESAVVLDPPCRLDLRQAVLQRKPWWLSVLHHLLLEGWAPIWRIAVLVLVAALAAVAVAVAGAAMLQTVLGAAGLAALLHRRREAASVQPVQ